MGGLDIINDQDTGLPTRGFSYGPFGRYDYWVGTATGASPTISYQPLAGGTPFSHDHFGAAAVALVFRDAAITYNWADPDQPGPTINHATSGYSASLDAGGVLALIGLSLWDPADTGWDGAWNTPVGTGGWVSQIQATSPDWDPPASRGATAAAFRFTSAGAGLVTGTADPTTSVTPSSLEQGAMLLAPALVQEFSWRCGGPAARRAAIAAVTDDGELRAEETAGTDQQAYVGIGDSIGRHPPLLDVVPPVGWVIELAGGAVRGRMGGRPAGKRMNFDPPKPNPLA